MIDSQFNTSVPNVKCIGDVTFGPMLAHKAEEEGIAAVEYIHSGYGHVAYNVSGEETACISRICLVENLARLICLRLSSSPDCRLSRVSFTPTRVRFRARASHAVGHREHVLTCVLPSQLSFLSLYQICHTRLIRCRGRMGWQDRGGLQG